LTLIAAEVLRNGIFTPWIGAGFAGALALILLARHSIYPHLELRAFPAVLIMALLVGALMVSGGTRPSLQQMGLTSLVGCVALLGVVAPRNVPLSPGQVNRADANYDTAIGSDDRTGLNVWEVSVQLNAALPSWDQDPGTIVFWYRSHEPYLSLVQATYLWFPDTLQYGQLGLPTLSTSEVEHLKGRTPRRLVILGLTKEDVRIGSSEILNAGIAPEKIIDRTLHAGNFTVYMESMLFRPAPCDQQWRTNSVGWISMPPTCG